MSDLIVPSIICFQTQKHPATLNNIRVIKGVLTDLRAREKLFACMLRARSLPCALFVERWSVKVYQKNSDKTFILKRPLQHLVLLETTIKKPANESQYSAEAAMNADAIRKLTTWLCYDPNPGG